MKRDEQIEMMQSAEKRTAGYLRAWLQDENVKAALRRHPRGRENHDDCAERRRRFG
ncbi:hypothetical protein [Methylobacterium nodulans]|uniref:Uncharacterized protein n=1 Tax=Methylobacterium nodulans (strain LMG 21967 / CNCM I-2342 / ORS 2060) TaxID=460265 RepID=B8IY61_METNO|nr:hypothetical protein [Methylobacterium nodulans]ACL63351.1 hypothetical protein Mnod_7760 [Methylobacterium nodulans ORS 2060]